METKIAKKRLKKMRKKLTNMKKYGRKGGYYSSSGSSSDSSDGEQGIGEYTARINNRINVPKTSFCSEQNTAHALIKVVENNRTYVYKECCQMRWYVCWNNRHLQVLTLAAY